ncbi:MAG: diaminopimelate epimerase [Acidobacteriaceae bacterium]
MVPFVKAHACGNDFLVIEESEAHGQHVALAQQLCQRNTSVGADGIEFLERRADGSFFLRLINADGSEAELSGNGTRCVAAWLAYSENLQQVVLGTHGGPRTCKVIRADGTHFEIESEMGVPRVTARVLNLPQVGEVSGAEVNIGNPHFVVFVENDEFRAHGLSWQELGQIICTSPLFPQGTNVEFVHILAPDKIEIRIFERGVGPTTSSGTGTCASSTAAIALRGVSRELAIVAPGGTQQVRWPSAEEPMLLTGPADMICWGGKAATK